MLIHKKKISVFRVPYQAKQILVQVDFLRIINQALVLVV
jgi:hypothetical protein